MNPHWLPGFVFRDAGEDWKHYEERLFRIFRQEFLDANGTNYKCHFHNQEVRLKKLPYDGHYPEAFTHLTTSEQDDNSKERLPDISRSERIKWPRPVIEEHEDCAICHYSECEKPWVWSYDHKTKIFLPSDDYLVILGQRNGYWMLITAYHMNRQHSIDKIRKEYKSQWATVIQ